MFWEDFVSLFITVTVSSCISVGFVNVRKCILRAGWKRSK